MSGPATAPPVQALSRQWAARQGQWLESLTLLAADMHALLTAAAAAEPAADAKARTAPCVRALVQAAFVLATPASPRNALCRPLRVA